MSFKICTSVFSLLLTTSGPVAAFQIQQTGPYLSHAKIEPLIALVTSHLTTTFTGYNECTFLHWQSSKGSSNSGNLIAQFSPHFTSVLAFTNNSLTESSLPIPNTKFHASCSVAVYLNLDYFSETSSLQVFPNSWFSRVPGGFPNSYHLIFHTLLNPYAFSLTLLPDPLQQMIHRIFISISSKRAGYRCDLWACDIFGKSCTSRLEISQAKTSLLTKQVDLRGGSLIWAVVTLPQISQTALENYIKYRKDIDVYITPFVEITEIFNGTPTLNQVPSQNFGTLDKDGKWNGAAGEVVYGRAHLSQGLFTKDRYEALFLSRTIDTDGLSFATGPPPSRAESPFFLIESYDWRIWMALLATIFFMLIISRQIIKKYFFVPSKIKNRTKQDGQKGTFSSGVIMFIISPLLEQPADSKRYQKFIKVSESRWMFGPWLLSIVALSTMFKTSLISKLTSPEVYNPPKDFQSLLKSGYHFNFLGANSTAGAVFGDLKVKGNMLVNELDKRIVTNYDAFHGKDCISQTYGKKFACLGIGNLLLEVGIRYLTEESGQPLYRISKEYLYSSYYSFCISKKLPHLLATIDKMMYHYAESGSYILFRKNIVRSAQKYGKLAAKRRKQANQNNVQQITASHELSHELENTLRSIMVLGLGFALATLVLTLELLFHYLSFFGIQFRVVRK